MDFNHYKEDLINNCIRLIKIPSIYDENTIMKGKPFGKAIDDCLNEALTICDELGVNTYKDNEGYYGFAEMGEGEDYIAILCHLDVVPTGNLQSWEYPPFIGKVEKNNLFGRGVADDKGPTMTAIYAVKALMDMNIKLKKRIRVIFELDEETLWRGMDVYVKKEKASICAFAPDSEFPFAYAEKGILELNLVRKTKANDILINGGQNYNSVAMEATYQGQLVSQIAKMIETENELDYEIIDEMIKVIGV